MQTRRTLIALAALAASLPLLAACNGGAPAAPVTSEDVSMGDPNAPVKMIEYASLACSHCAEFNNEVFGDFKAKYIDTGEVYFTSREMLIGYPPFATAGFLLARCAGEDRYFDVVDDIYQAQAEIIASQQFGEGLERIGRRHGVSGDAFEACLADAAAIEAMQTRVNRYMLDEGINSTPTFIINGRRYEGEKTLAELDEIVALAKSAPAAQ